jgi:hypothetical protein
MYQVEPLFIDFSESTAKKGCRQGPGSGNPGESLVKATISQRQYQYQNHTKITKKKTTFYAFTPCFEAGFTFVAGFEEGYYIY